MTVSRTEIVNMVARRTGVPQDTVRKTIGGLLDVIQLTVSVGEEVHLRGFGQFYARTLAARTNHIPRPEGTMTVEVPERQTMAFIPARTFRERMNSRS